MSEEPGDWDGPISVGGYLVRKLRDGEISQADFDRAVDRKRESVKDAYILPDPKDVKVYEPGVMAVPLGIEAMTKLGLLRFDTKQDGSVLVEIAGRKTVWMVAQDCCPEGTKLDWVRLYGPSDSEIFLRGALADWFKENVMEKMGKKSGGES